MYELTQAGQGIFQKLTQQRSLPRRWNETLPHWELGLVDTPRVSSAFCHPSPIRRSTHARCLDRPRLSLISLFYNVINEFSVFRLPAVCLQAGSVDRKDWRFGVERCRCEMWQMTELWSDRGASLVPGIIRVRLRLDVRANATRRNFLGYVLPPSEQMLLSDRSSTFLAMLLC